MEHEIAEQEVKSVFPNLIGLPLNIAASVLRENGCVYEIYYDYAKEMDPMVVIAQGTPPGTPIDTTIFHSITVNSKSREHNTSKEEIIPPDLRGYYPNEAFELLQDTNFGIKTITSVRELSSEMLQYAKELGFEWRQEMIVESVFDKEAQAYDVVILVPKRTEE